MAKQDYSIDVGMWAVQPDQSTGDDAALDTLVPHFEKVWDGHSCPTKRACNVLMTYGHYRAWGYNSEDNPDDYPGLNTRPKQQAYAFGEWILRIKEANASSGGAGAPRYLSGIVFRGMWNLLKTPVEAIWTPREIQQMVDYFLDYFDGVGDPLPENKGSQLSRSDLPLLKGYLLGDDFAKWRYSCQWNEIVQRVHSSQLARSINRPFYFTHQVFSEFNETYGTGIWENGAPYGQRLEKLRRWLDIFNIVGATPVFMLKRASNFGHKHQMLSIAQAPIRKIY
jgi:hypothetical protein